VEDAAVDWNDITINSNEAEFSRILETWWGWLLTKPYRPVMMTVFGDWFLVDEGGQAYFLDLLEGTVQQVAESFDELGTKMQDEITRDNWFLTGFVISMQRAGIYRPHGQTYAYKIHPIIGGKTESANLMLLGIEVWQSICSQLHQQLRQLLPGTRILGMEHQGDWTIKLKTDAEAR
jgi:hypothetical protein